MKKITPFLWFNDQAEEAANYYVSIFKNSSITNVVPGPGGKAMVVTFTLDGQDFVALNGGPVYTFTEAISLSVDCVDQAEVDDLWEKLSAGGSPGRCAWLKDRYGLSWQIVPRALPRLMSDPDRVKAGRVMQAMMGMSKIDVAKLQEAYDQE
jgi:predicted 3-demethylubiquinone-9 3-methyltransferase (glyoxalase superfamily)